MDNNKIKHKAFSSAIWNTATNLTSQLVSFVIQVILARLLDPSAYGTIAMITIFVAVANVFVTTGYSSALIQKKEVSELECSTSFWIGLFIAIVGYLILFLCSPFVAEFYGNDTLTVALRMQALTLIFGALTSVHNALINKMLQFKKFFLINISGIIMQGVVGISLALMGYGVWALLLSYLANKIVVLVITWMVVKWKPKLIFSLGAFKGLFSFSSKVLILTLIDTIYSNIRSLIIGKKYNEETLAFYNRGNQIPDLVATNGIGSINGILFPTLSCYANESDGFKRAYRRAFSIMFFLSFPVYLGLAAVMPSLLTLLLTEKWSKSIIFARMISITFIFNPFFMRSHVYNAKGRSDVSMWLSIGDKIIVSVLLGIAILYTDIYFLVMSAFISNAISTIIGFRVNVKILGYNVKEQIGDAFPPLIASLIMFFLVENINKLLIPDWWKLMIQLVLGVGVYIGGCEILKVDGYVYLKGLVKNYIAKRN